MNIKINIRIHSSYLLIHLFFILLNACTATEPSRAEFALGTVCSVTLFEKADNNIYNEIFSRIREIENLMSVNIPSSDVSRINAAAGIAAVQVHKDTFTVIQRALFFAEQSGGAFDPCVGPLVSLWGIGSDDPRVPSTLEIEEILPLINRRDIELDENTRSVFLKRTGMALDLGAIAKGFAADEIVNILNNTVVKSAIIDLGGDIIIYGEKKDKTPWRVGIQNPNEGRGSYAGILQITLKENSQKTVVTSGVYERFFVENGKRFHHIFSPSHGYPVDNGLLSVTVIAAGSMDADALSTAVFVLDFEEGLNLIESFPGTEAIFIFEDNSIYKTQGADFTITDKNFYFK